MFSYGTTCAQNDYEVLWNDNESFLETSDRDLFKFRNLNNEVTRRLTFHPSVKYYDKEKSKDVRVFVNENGVVSLVFVNGNKFFRSVGDSIFRVDQTYFSLSSGADVFSRNDTIFKFGGYGHWSNRNAITFFDNEVNKWEFYKISPPVIPPALSSFSSCVSNDFYYVYGGVLVDNFTGRPSIKNKDVWAFNFSSRSWKNLGVSNIPNLDDALHFSISSGVNLILNEGKSGLNASFISFPENSIRNVPTNKTSFSFAEDKVFFSGDSIYIVDRKTSLISLSLDSAFDFANPISEKPIYVNTSVLFEGLTTTAFFSILFIVVLILFLRYKRNQRPRISDFGIRYKGISYSFKPKEKNVIRLVLTNKEVSSQQMFDAVEDTSLSYPQNNKIKNDTIKKVNRKINKILDIEDFIQAKKLESDGRVLIYYTQHAHLFVINNNKS